MKAGTAYAATGLVALGLLVLGLWPWLDPAGRNGVLLAAGVAWLVQVGAFAILLRHREEPRRFLAAWVGGTLARMGLVLAAAFVVARVEGVAPAPALLALAGFFFGLLLLEPVFFRRHTENSTDGT